MIMLYTSGFIGNKATLQQNKKLNIASGTARFCKINNYRRYFEIFNGAKHHAWGYLKSKTPCLALFTGPNVRGWGQ